MTFYAVEEDIGTTPVHLGGGGPGSIVVTVRNAGADDVYIGGEDVTTATGLPLGPGAAISMDVEREEAVYAVAASGTIPVRVLRHGR